MQDSKGKRNNYQQKNLIAPEKSRWVVEAVYGLIGQKYRVLHHNMDKIMLLKVKLLCKIVGFFHNTLGNDFTEEIVEYYNCGC